MVESTVRLKLCTLLIANSSKISKKESLLLKNWKSSYLKFSSKLRPVVKISVLSLDQTLT